MATYYSDYCRQPSAVYRAYDVEGRLLYVGVTINPEYRVSDHRAHKAWWRTDVARMDVTWHPDRETAKAAERDAITEENPLHNIRRPKVVAG